MTYGALPYGSAPYGSLGGSDGREQTIEERIEAALFTYVSAIGITGAPPIAWPNVKFEPQDIYLRVLHFPNRNQRLFMKGPNVHLRQGILQITVVSLLNVGPTPATALAGEVAQNFPADLALYRYGLKVTVQAAPDVSPAQKTDVSWDALVSIRYQTFA